MHVRDSGLLHALLGLGSERQLTSHPKVGASWEGFALEAAIARLGTRPEECFFWATHGGAELDLRGPTRLGFEFKRTSTPTLTRSMLTALDDFRLAHLHVVHAGERSFPLHARVRAASVRDLRTELQPLRSL